MWYLGWEALQQRLSTGLNHTLPALGWDFGGTVDTHTGKHENIRKSSITTFEGMSQKGAKVERLEVFMYNKLCIGTRIE